MTPLISEDSLYELYIIKNISASCIAKEYNTNESAIRKLLLQYKFRKYNEETMQQRSRRRKTKVADEVILDLYYNQKKTGPEIAKILDINPTTVNRRLSKLGISHKTMLEIHYNLRDKEYGLLKVMCLDENQDEKGVRLWVCECQCKKRLSVATGRLTSGDVKCCGDDVCKRKYIKTWKGYEEIHGSHWCTIKNSAEKRNIEFNITIEEAWDLYINQNGKCAISGIDIRFGRTHDVDTKNASLDRIDSSKPYTKENCQWVDININYMKNNLEEIEFIKLCGLVWEYSKKRLQ